MSVDNKVAEWTPDCQGKWDYDADIILLSSRYWPRGGGFDVFDSRTGAWQRSESRPEIRPSAHTSIMIGEETIADAHFDGDTEEAVKAQVETWAAEKVAIVKAAVRAALSPHATTSHDTFRNALHQISLASQNSMSSKEECGRIARAALAWFDAQKGAPLEPRS